MVVVGWLRRQAEVLRPCQLRGRRFSIRQPTVVIAQSSSEQAAARGPRVIVANHEGAPASEVPANPAAFAPPLAPLVPRQAVEPRGTCSCRLRRQALPSITVESAMILFLLRRKTDHLSYPSLEPRAHIRFATAESSALCDDCSRHYAIVAPGPRRTCMHAMHVSDIGRLALWGALWPQQSHAA